MKIIKKLKAKRALVVYKIITKAEEKCEMARKSFYEADSLTDKAKKLKIQRKCWYNFKKNRSIICNIHYFKIINDLPDSFNVFKDDVNQMIKNVEKI